jgi:lipopolysaccharide heptosyltransferase I
MNILIIRVSAIGDVIHTLPALFYLKQHADISWVVQEKAASILKNQIFLKNLFILPDKFLYPKNWHKTIKIITEIKRNKWDAIVDFQGLLKTSILYSTIKGEKFGFDKKNSREFLSTFFTHHHTTPQYKNIIQKNLALASNVISKLTNTKSCPSIETLRKDFCLKIPKNNFFGGEKFITIAPNTTWKSKQWPTDYWKEFVKQVSRRIKVILIGKDFGGQAAEIDQFVTCVPKCDLLGVASIIKKSKILIAPDTGILHLADFLGTKAIGIFGPTSATRHGPLLTKENSKLAIQIPCPHKQKKNHGLKDCMRQLTPEKLLKIVLNCISR